MDTQGKTEALLEAIERRLSEISERQHALAVEKARLVEQTTPLRLGVISPDLALAQLKAKGVTLRGLAATSAVDRRPQEVVLRAIPPQRSNVTPLPALRNGLISIIESTG
jgi:hypothetical protein